MTRLLFGQSYFLRFDEKLYDAMQPYPPLGTLYAASYLRAQGYEVALFDAMLADSTEVWAAALDRERPDFAVIYEDNFNYLSKMCLLNMRDAAFSMIQMAKARGLPVIVAGSDATDEAEAYLTQGADFVLLGEGELTLSELLAALTGQSNLPLSDIPGLAYHADGQPRRNVRRPDANDLDAFPFPAWDLVDVERYRRIWQERHGYFSMNMVTTRGCPYHCNWCAKPIWGQRYHGRSPKNVVAELRWLKETFDPDHIWFADDIMGLKPGWWAAFADEVVASDAVIPFKCLSRADLIVRDPANTDALRRAGCQIVWLGAESGAQSVLNAMEKGTTVEQIYAAAADLHVAGVQVGFFLQFGYPGETLADIERTLQMVRDCHPDDIGMSVSYPLPGTKFHENVKVQLGDQHNWVDSADLAMMYHGPHTTDFYRQLHVVLHKEFRSRRAAQAWAAVLRRETPLSRRHWREAAATLFRLATLPLARRKLAQLSTAPAGIAPPPHMSLAEATQPTAQE